MGEWTSIGRSFDHIGDIRRTLGDLQGMPTVVHELIQNADDAPGATRMRFEVGADALTVWNDGEFTRCDDVAAQRCGLVARDGHKCDFHSFRSVAGGDKRHRPNTTGAFGLGFTAVYQITDRPELVSNGQRWRIDEMRAEAERIQAQPLDEETNGTTFTLPWATEESAFRRELRQQAITAEDIAAVPYVIVDLIPKAMIFLRKVRRIEVVADGRSTAIDVSRTADELALRSSDGWQRRWRLLHGKLGEAASELKAHHALQIEAGRSEDVIVALPQGDDIRSGFLHATLPTEEDARVPILLNGDFFPASDRKRVRLDDAPEAQWNREVIAGGAALLARSLDDLPDAIGDERVVGLLKAAHDTHRAIRDAPGTTDSIFGSYWSALIDVLSEARVVPVLGGGRGTTRTVRLWSNSSEREAASPLGRLGVRLVDTPVQPTWFQLRQSDVGIEPLHLRHVVTGLAATGSQVAGWSEEDVVALWGVIDHLLDRRDGSNSESRTAIQQRPIAPARDGRLRPLDALIRVDSDLRLVADALSLGEHVLDEDRLSEVAPRFVDLAETPNARTTIALLGKVAAKVADLPVDLRRQILVWAADHRGQLDGDARRTLASLPIFPTASGLCPLDGLALPSDFVDELGLARLIAIHGIEDIQPLLRDLGASELTLESYVSDVIRPRLAGDVDVVERERLLAFLAGHVSRLRDKARAKAALAQVPAVPCTDGTWRKADETYLRHDVARVLGDDVAIAEVPVKARKNHEDFFRWLGAADRPRATDVIQRCKKLVAAGATRRAGAEAIIAHVGQRFVSDKKWVVDNLGPLKNLAWVPVEGGGNGRPQNVKLRFRKSLFATQGKFIDISATTERDASAFLQWLGMDDRPTVGQVIDHLLHCADTGAPVGDDMWLYLDQNAADGALSRLIDRRCLLLKETGTYVRPSDVFWRSNPFGRWRHLLGPAFEQRRALLDRLGVAEDPGAADAVEVLGEIAAHHGGEKAPLLDADQAVVQACWQIIAAHSDESHGRELARLECVLDARGWLRRPRDVFFRDTEALASRFSDQVGHRLIDRPDGVWPALTDAGVRNLSDAVVTRIVDQHEIHEAGLIDARLDDRRDLLIRVLAHEHPETTRALDRLIDDQQHRRLSRLVIQQELNLEGVTVASEPFERGAHFDREREILLWVQDQNEPDWLHIAREIVRAVGIADATSVTAVVRSVLSSPTASAARAELDELGIPPIDRWEPGAVEPQVTEGLGGVAAPGPSDDDLGIDIHADVEDVIVDEEEGPPDATSDAEGGRPRTVGAVGPTGSGGGDTTTTSGRRTPGTDEGARPETPSSTGPRVASETGIDTTGHPDRSRRNGGGDGTSQTRLRSYVVPRGRGSGDDTTQSGTSAVEEIDRAAIDAVLAHERAAGREPEEMAHDHPGYDIVSVAPSGERRYIEVKGTDGPWGAAGVTLSHRQFQEAQRAGEEFWLYVVDQARKEPRIHMIRDPAGLIDQYVFDSGWTAVEVPLDAMSTPLPDIPLIAPGEPTDEAVAFRPHPVDATTTGFVSCRHPERADDWFAIQVPGDSLGMGKRGGLAFVRPLGDDPTDGTLVLVTLADQVDEDTGSPLALRVWAPELDATGISIGLRLESVSSVAPLTVAQPDRIVVLGEIVASQAPIDDD